MTDVEVHIDLEGQVRPLGILHRQASRRGETVTFEYDETWLGDANRFSIEPALTLTAGALPGLRCCGVVRWCGPLRHSPPARGKACLGTPDRACDAAVWFGGEASSGIPFLRWERLVAERRTGRVDVWPWRLGSGAVA